MAVVRTHKTLAYHILAVALIAAIAFILCWKILIVHAATYTWDGGDVDDQNWSSCDNWSTDICPTSSDTVVFNSTSVEDSTVDAGFGGTVDAIQVNAGYTGIITLARDLTLDNSGGFSQSAGTFDISGFTLTLSANIGSLTVSGGTFLGTNATTTFSGNSLTGGVQTLTCTGTWPGVVSPGTSASTFTLASGCNATLAQTISKTGSITLAGDATVQAGSTITISGSDKVLTVTGSLAGLASLATTTFSGNSGTNTQTLTCTGTWPGVVSPGTSASTFTLASGCNATLAQTISKTGSITLAGDATALSGSTITISGVGSIATALTVTGSLAGLANLATTTFSGTDSGGVQTLTCTGTWPGALSPGSGAAPFVLSSGCVAALGSTVSKSGTVTINGTLNTVNFNTSAGTVTVGSAGTLKLQGGQTTFKQPVLDSGSTVEYTGASTYTVLKAGSSYSNLVISGSGTYSTSTALTITDAFTQTAGTFTPSATTTFSGSSGATVTTSSGSDFSSVAINKTSATVTLAGSGLDATGNLFIDAGTLDVSAAGCSSVACNITVGGNWSNSGTFTARTGTVTLNGSNQSLAGATTFYKLTKSTSSTDTLSFPAGVTQTITNTLTLNGAASNLLSLRSSTGGTQWSIDPQGTRTISYLNVTDSNNTNATAIDATGGTNTSGGNNTNWTFSLTPSVSSLGPASLTNGSTGSDTTPTLTFTLSDADAGDTTRFDIEIATDAAFASPVVDYLSALATPGDATFTVGQAAGSGTYTTGSSGQTLSDASYYWRVRVSDNNYATSSYSTANSGAVAFVVDTTTESDSGSSGSSGGGSIVRPPGRITNVSGSASLLIGPATAKVGNTVTLTVFAKTAAGTPVKGATVVISVAGANPGTPVVSNLGDGSYLARYVATTQGIDTVTATVDGIPVTADTSGRSDGTLSINITPGSATVPAPKIGSEYKPPVPPGQEKKNPPAATSTPPTPPSRPPPASPLPVFSSGLTSECYRAFSWSRSTLPLTITRTIGAGHETVVATPNPNAPWYIDIDPITGTSISYSFKHLGTGEVWKTVTYTAADLAACAGQTPPGVVEEDIDNDGNQEQYINGVFQDSDGSSVPLAIADDGILLDTDNDGVPDTYWLPESESGASLTSPVIAAGDRLNIVKGTLTGVHDFQPLAATTYEVSLDQRNTYAALVVHAAEAVPFPEVEGLPSFADVATGILPLIGLAGMGMTLTTLARVSLMTLPGDLRSLFLHIVDSLLVFFGLRKRRGRPWGIVYNSVTKMPVHPAEVRIQDQQGTVIDSTVTDPEGRFGFAPLPGTYALYAAAYQYRFPSMREAHSIADEVYDNRYVNGAIQVGEGEVIVKNIPLDPLALELSVVDARRRRLHIDRRRERLFMGVGYALFALGASTAVYTAYMQPTLYAFSVLALHLAVLLLRVLWIPHHRTVAVMNAEGLPYVHGVVRVFDRLGGALMKVAVADRAGRVYAIVPPGTYRLTITELMPDGSYRHVYTDESFEMPRGVFEGDVVGGGKGVV